jgi:soluble lytic murein transglycosylase
MSTLPMRHLQRSVPPRRRGRWALWFLVPAAVLLFWIYSGGAWAWFKPAVHKDSINKYATHYRFDPLWIMAIMKTESGFSPWAHSSRGAVGLMQLLPSTAQDIAPEAGLPRFTPADLRDPDTNIRLGVHYLSKLEHLFPEDKIAILSAYNAGPGITRQWRKGKPALDLEDIAYPETRQFVLRVQRNYRFLKAVQNWKHWVGFGRG